jgi:hypothetical protein
MASYELVLPFLTDDVMFTRGVAFGMLYMQMRDPAVTEIKDYCRLWLQEQITLAANRTGWRVVEMSPARDGWFLLHMEREAGPAASRPEETGAW